MKKTGIGSLLAILVVALMAQVIPAAQNQAPINDPIRPERIQMHEKFGTAEIFSGSFTAPPAASKMEKAHAFIATRQESFKMQQPAEELELINEETDQLGLTHLRFQQVYQGLRVWGCQTIVHFKGENTIYLVGGQTIPTPTFGVIPAVSAAGAVEQAMADLKAELTGSGYESEIELIVYPDEGDPKLAQLVTITHPDDGTIRWRVFVDAQSGEILNRFNDVHFDGPDIGTGPDTRDSMRTFDIYETGGIYQMINTTHNGTITTYDNYYGGGPISTDPDGDKVWDDASRQKAEVAGHYYGNKTYEYFLNTHGRDGYDGLGHDLLVNVHDPRYLNNAYWNGEGINFADGDGTYWLPWSGSLDVVAHEFTHAVISYTAGLIYQFQSGALSEHFSDAFGCMVDRDDWLLGEEIGLVGNYVRNMENPNATGHPKHMSDYRNLPYATDNGGVHINCGIPNHAFYKSATFMGKDKAEQIWYRALSTYLTPGSGFYFWAGMIVQSTIDLYGAGSPELGHVELGLLWVGLGSAYAMPEYVEVGAVTGQVGSTNLWIYNPGTSTGSVDVSGISPSIPNLTLGPGPGYQATIPDGDSSEYVVSYDASGLGECDLGIYRDTLRFEVTGPYGLTDIKLPMTLSIGITTFQEENEDISSTCVSARASNTTSLDIFSRDANDALFEASLLVGVIDGGDTTVYRDFSGAEKFAPIDTFKSDTDYASFVTVSEEGRIRSEVTYTFSP
ncbi:MAG: peptidase M4 family protein, partial [Candidatus Zixiibacteriota bacterium]